MRHLFLATAALALFVLPSAAAPTPDHYTFRIKTAAGFLPVGEVTRHADGTVAVKGIAAPAIDNRADALVADWASYKVPSSIDIVRYLPNGSYMRNTTTKRTVTFTPKDALFKVAVLDRFLDAHKLEALGMEQIAFIIHDTEGPATPPAVAVDDGGSGFTNFRKNTQLEFQNGHLAFYIYAPVHPPQSFDAPADKKFALARTYDRGGVFIAWIDLAADGSVTIHPNHTADVFEQDFRATLDSEQVSVAVYDNGAYKYVAVAKTEKRSFEAAIAAVSDRHAYDVTPALDPAVFR